MPRCLVTGAAGFLGRYVRREAEKRGIEVIDTGALRLPTKDLAPLVAHARPDFVVHLAGPASVASSFEDPHVDFIGSVAGTACLIDALRRASPRARLLLVSSAAVYGNPPELPVREDAPTQPISPYGYHKLMSELLVEEACRIWEAWGAVARVFSAYGAGLRRQVVYDLCTKVACGEPLRVDGTGDESRDFIHAADVARAVWTVLQNAPGKGERFNVATGTETRLSELAALIAAARGISAARFTGSTRTGDPTRWCADVTALWQLGFRPAIRLEDGVLEVLRWVQGNA